MADKQNWDLINKKNSIGPALGMAMGRAIDITLSVVEYKKQSPTEEEVKGEILKWRNWIYEENNKKHQELLADLPKEGEENEGITYAQSREDYEF